MTQKINILFEATSNVAKVIKKDTAAIDGLKNKVDNVGKSSVNLKDKLGSVAVALGAATGLVAGFGVALAGAYSVLKEGADLELTSGKFDRLSESINTTSDVLMNDLRSATRGLYTDAELMASATEFMSLGLAKTHDEAVRLSSVASALNMNMNQLVLTLTNKTTMRFDAIGVAVDGFKEKVNDLKKTGMDADAAFKEAFLQQAEAQIEKVGHAADTTAGKLQRFEADIKNISDALKVQLAQGLAPSISGWSKFIDAIERGQKAQENALKAGLSLQEASAENQRIMGGGTSEYENFAVALDTATRGYMAMTPVIRENTEELDDNASSMMFAGESAAAILSAGMSMTAMTESYNEKLSDLNTKLSEEQELLLQMEGRYSTSTELLEGQRKKVSELEGQIESLDSKMDTQTEKWILGLMDQSGASVQAQIAYANYAGLIDSESAGMASAVIGVAKQYDHVMAGQDGVAVSASAMGQMIQENLDIPVAGAPAATQAISTITGSFEQGVETVHGYNIGATRLINKILRLDGMEATATINIRVNGSVPRIGDSSGTVTLGGGGGDSTNPELKYGATGISDFTVPPGYPNDSFGIAVQSGERVNVETRGQQMANDRGSGGNSELIAAISNLPDANARSMAKALGDVMAKIMQ